MTPPDFIIDIIDSSPETVIVVGGELDMLTSPVLAAALEDTVGQSRDVVVDLAGVTFIDSTALQTIIRAERALAATSQPLRLRNPSAVVTRTLTLTGLVQHFDNDAVPRGTAPA